ncbi:MAG TPA: hypothetical protein V6D05_09380 [Stenomitos sp.]
MRPLRRLMVASALALALLPLAGCVRLFKLSPETDAYTDRIYMAGNEWAVMEDANARVAISGEKVTSSEIYLRVSVTNKGDKRVDVLPDEIRVWALGGDAGKRPLKVWSPDRFMGELRNRQNLTMFIDSFASALSSADAGRKTVVTKTEGAAQSTTYGGYDPKVTRERYAEKTVTVVDDPAARQAAQERDRRRLEKQAEKNAESNDRLDASLLKATTLFKGDKVEGVVIVDSSDAAQYTVSLALGEHIYRVRFFPKE